MNNYVRPLDFSDVLIKLYPNKNWRVINDPQLYENIVWEETAVEKPTKETLLSVLEELNNQAKSVRYKNNRAQEYPPLEDLADAVYWQSKGDNSKMQAYLIACDAVKQKYPKGA